MPGFSFTTVEPNQIGRVTKFDIPLNEWVGLKFGSGYTDTLGNQISRFTEDSIYDDNNPAKPEVLNRAYGIEGHLKFEQPMSIQRARLMHERKRKELATASYLESASHSWFSGKAAAGFGAAMIGGLSNPVDLGLSFLPFIGSEKLAGQVAKVGGGSFRQALARGVIAEESLAGRIPLHRLTASVIDGTVNQAAMEIPIAIQKYRDQADYTAADFAFNVAAGGAFSGAIKGLGLALERAGKLWMEMDPRIKEAKLNETLHSIITGESRQTEFAGMDEAAIRAKVEERIRRENPLVSNAKEAPVVRSSATEIVDAFKAEQFAEQVSDIDKGIIARLNQRYDVGERGPELIQAMGEYVGKKYDPQASLKSFRRDLYETISTIEKTRPLLLSSDPAVKSQIEANIAKLEQRKAQIEEDITRTALAIDDIESRVAAERKASTESFLENAKAEHEAKLKGMIDVETKRAIDELRQSNPAPNAETVKRYTFKNIPDDANIKAVEDDFAQLNEDVIGIAATEAERLELEAEIKAGLNELDEVGLSGEKAIDEMIPCVTAKAKL